MSAVAETARRVLARAVPGAAKNRTRLGYASFAALLTEGRPAAWWPAAALLAAAVPCAAFTTLVLYHFYTRGSFVWDSGLLAYLISSADPRLLTPALAGGGSFFAVHFTPIFVLISLLRRLLPIADAQFFAGFVGLCHALPAVAVFWVLYSRFRLRTAFGLAAATLVSIAFCFNGLALAVARYPHFEMLIVGTALLFFVALMQRRSLFAVLFFTACLLTREDAGFHLFGLLFLLIGLNRFRGTAWRDQRREIAFAALALGYSLAVTLLQHGLFGGQSSFVRIYLGEPLGIFRSPSSASGCSGMSSIAPISSCRRWSRSSGRCGRAIPTSCSAMPRFCPGACCICWLTPRSPAPCPATTPIPS
jgi:hypothetical protein